MSKIGSQKLKNPQGKVENLKPFEDAIALETFLQYLDAGSEIGAALLKKPGKTESYRVVFGFSCRGIAPILSEEEIINAVRGLEAFDDLPLRETLTIHQGLFIDDNSRQAQLQQQMGQVDSSSLRLLLGGVAKRTRELTEAGTRKHNFLHLFATYTVEESQETGKRDAFESVLGALEKGWHQLNGSYQEVKQIAIQSILLEAYTQGYNRYQRLLSNQIGLNLEPMNLAQVKACAWQIFNQSPKPSHSLATVTIKIQTGEFEETVPEIHPKSYLLSHSVPKAERNFIQVKDKYTGVLLFADKPDIADDEPIAQLFYLWETFISRESVFDIEIISQIRRGNSKLIKDKMASLTKQAQSTSRVASERGEIDVGASLAVEDALDAQVALHRAGEPFYTGTVILVHRKTPYLLNRACADIMSYFRREGWVVREEEYAWRLWLETMPLLQWSSLLSKPFNRQRTYMTSEVSRILPLVCNRSLAEDGFELLANEGGTPIFLPIYQECFHLGIFAASGSGKSVLFSDLVAQSLPQQIPTTLLEFPRADGTGSFDGLCHYLPEFCSYVDIGKTDSGLNLLEPPDLRGLPSDLKKERFTDAKEETLGILAAMVLGFNQESKTLMVNSDTIRSLLRLSLETFYNDPEIRERFAGGFQRGFGSGEWQQMPTLVDFLSFVSLERLRLPTEGGDTISSLSFIRLKLRDWLESRLGRFLSRSTTFSGDRLCQIISLRGLNNDTDAAIMGSIAYLGAFRRSLQYPNSIFGIDEAPILLEFDAIAQRIGELSANGRKSGIRLILAAQGLGSVLKCVSADKILDNLKIKLVGKVYPQSIEQYVDVLKYPYELIVENASEKYGINKQENYTCWLYDDGRLIPVRHYPSRELLALVANSTKESQIRTDFWKQFQGDPVRGLHQLTQAFAQNGKR